MDFSTQFTIVTGNGVTCPTFSAGMPKEALKKQWLASTSNTVSGLHCVEHSLVYRARPSSFALAMHAREKGLAKVAVGMQLIKMAEECPRATHTRRVRIALPRAYVTYVPVLRCVRTHVVNGVYTVNLV